jgi:hypothetical protein
MLTDRPIHRVGRPWQRTNEAGLKRKLGCHAFRATGITAYLDVDGTFENVLPMAAH